MARSNVLQFRKARRNADERPILDFVTEAVNRELQQGAAGALWVWHHVMTAKDRARFDLWLVKTQHPLAWEAGSPESRWRRLIDRMVEQTKEWRSRTGQNPSRRFAAIGHRRAAANPARAPRPKPRAVSQAKCEICGKGTKECSFEKACSCWYGVPCGAEAPRCCAEKTCPHTCTEDDPCSFCVGRGDCLMGRIRKAKNPPRQVSRGRGGRVLIYPEGRVVGTWYGRHRNGGLFKHRFTHRAAAIYGNADGSITIRAHRGRLWAMFR